MREEFIQEQNTKKNLEYKIHQQIESYERLHAKHLNNERILKSVAGRFARWWSNKRVPQ